MLIFYLACPVIYATIEYLTEDATIGLLAVLIYILFDLLYYRIFSARRWKGGGVKDLTQSLHLHHKNDEAINGLQALAGLQPSIFSEQSVVRLWEMIVSWLGVILTIVMVAVVFVQSRGLIPDNFFTPHINDLLKIFRSQSNWLGVPGFDLAWAVWIGCLITSVLGILVSVPLSARWSKSAWDQMVQHAIGGDVHAERLKGITSHAYWAESASPFLPNELADELTLVADAAAAKSIPKLRAAIGDLAFALSNQGNSNAMAQYFTWDELIHTAYFKVPRFRKLVCYAIAHSPGFRPSEKLKADPDYEKLGLWLAEIQGQTPTAAAAVPVTA